MEDVWRILTVCEPCELWASETGVRNDVRVWAGQPELMAEGRQGWYVLKTQFKGIRMTHKYGAGETAIGVSIIQRNW